MATNESNFCMEVKLEIHDKRPESLKFRTWTKCQVQIEPIKCFPCFLRITIQSLDDVAQRLSVTINVPGITVSLATSRTKLFTYGLFWTHNRHDCFIYFALDTDVLCRKHMRWLRKSIKSLEMHRQSVLEHRRKSRYVAPVNSQSTDLLKKKFMQKQENDERSLSSILRPLPQIPVVIGLNESSNRDENNFQISDIYEEISDKIVSSSISRCELSSRSSVASGIYEEMKPTIVTIATPPSPPPLPPPRKRLNTYETERKALGMDIRRSNTTPESEMYKKKKYRSLLDIFNAARCKRSASVNEKHASTMDDLVNGQKENEVLSRPPIKQSYHHQCHNKKLLWSTKKVLMESNKRNSFSSPDLSKINLWDDDILSNSFKSPKMQNSNVLSDDLPITHAHLMNDNQESEGLNLSEQLSMNFNFSAQNCSTVNLLGARAAVPTITPNSIIHHNGNNKIVLDDNLSGYCIMAPIKEKIIGKENATAVEIGREAVSAEECGTQKIEVKNVKDMIVGTGIDGCTSSTSTTSASSTSGYATYNSTTSSSMSNSNHIKLEQLEAKLSKLNNEYDVLPIRKLTKPNENEVIQNDFAIYENMQTPLPLNDSTTTTLKLYENIIHSTPPTTPPINITTVSPSLTSSNLMNKNISEDLYENLLAIKVTQELEQESFTINGCTSTPTETTDLKDSVDKNTRCNNSIYQTPRRNIINVDEKMSSYYPNTTSANKNQRNYYIRKQETACNSPDYYIEPDNNVEKQNYLKNFLSMENFNNKNGTRLHNDNVYISSPINITGQRYQLHSKQINKNMLTVPKTKKICPNICALNVQRYPDNHYSYSEKKVSKTINDRTLHHQNELKKDLYSIIQNIDFKFDDPQHVTKHISEICETNGISNFNRAEYEYEKYYVGSKKAAKLLNEFAAMTPMQQKQRNVFLMTQPSSLTSPLSPTSSVIVRSDVASRSRTCTTPKVSILEEMTTKNVASLPRFKKFDLSPLKIKINNVLQRQVTSNDFTTQSSETK